ncbi:uncharacterized protein LOC129568241 [Sitodiplosis mosellana]|uniref:uncharacterized protein LOC129568241 n=1 Tax=Sitodiplosis mosellana TaxID=263140 RepID=UPI002444C876|nr:uncharacterized protein LOC129568241 [Sitodiplosis mosellana]
MKKFFSFILLIQVDIFTVFAATNYICSNSSSLIFVCDDAPIRNIVNTQSNIENSNQIAKRVESPIPTFESFKVGNQISENAKFIDKNGAIGQNSHNIRVERSPDGESMENSDQPVHSTEPNSIVEQTTEVPKPRNDSPEVQPLVRNLEAKPQTAELRSEKTESEITEIPTENKASKETSIKENKSPPPAATLVETKPAENSLSNVESKSEVKTEHSASIEVKPEPDSKENKREPTAEAKTNDKSVEKTPSITDESNLKCFFGDAKTIETYPRNNFVYISYENCHSPRLPTTFNTFSAYKNLKVLNISNIGLETFEIQGADHLESIFASYNNFTELPLGLFSFNNSIIQLDLSHNRINRIDPVAFADLVHLENLNLSWNSLITVDPILFVKQANLQDLDLSNNQFAILDAQLFNQLLKLKKLNLANNHFNRINFELFSGLINLIQLDLNGNQLIDVNGFKIDSFPKLETFGINDNHFNCSYLEVFLAKVAPKSIDFVNGQLAHGANIHGVSCIKPDGSIEGKLHTMANNIEDVVSTMKLSLALLCLTMFALIIFIVAIRRKLNKATGRTAIYELSEDVDGRKEGTAVICT